ncbi:MAG: hypothetical protein KatS3mg002_0563 [Candidatus Woesearchaeota archaeon]|nr:MAG: hypothetical protein KatS3mg002_0563 [Candidatus Woesearchaeota archaeon]
MSRICIKRQHAPYFILDRFRNKKITGRDIVEILSYYNNMYGDYFNTSPKTSVCSDQIILPILTSGIDLEKLMKEIPGNEYKIRNISSFLNFLDKNKIKNINYFHNKDHKKIFYSEGYDKVIPENFGLEKFEEGQAVIFNRYFLEGPFKGKEQRTNVHIGVISKVEYNKIKYLSMVTSRSSEIPYNTRIMATLETNFQYWYDGLRREYTGSDETKFALTYRTLAILDMTKIINDLKDKELK